MTKVVKRAALLACTACLLTSASFAASPAKEARLAGVPNPIVTYDTYQAAAKTAGFAPLYLTKDAGYSCNYISLISKDTADLGFQKLGQTSTTVRVRTMPQKAAKGTKDISGVYSVTWKDQGIDGTTVSVAKISDNSYAAHWKVGDYLFSAQAENMSAAEFQSLLEDSLVDASTHYFVK